MTDKCLHSYIPILEKRFGLYYGKCFTCGWLGPIAGTAYEAGQLFWQKAKKEFQLVETPDIRNCESMTTTQLMPITEAKEKYGRRTVSPVFGAPYGAQTATGANIQAAATKQHQALAAKLVNQTYQQLMESIVIQNQATQKPYWIIVSDEGHAAIPHKHFVKAEAEKESQRLTESKPGITFTVFEAKSSVFTPKADTKKTEYAETDLVYWHKGSFYPYGHQRYF